MPLRIVHNDDDNNIVYEAKLNLNPEVYMIDEEFNTERAGKYELEEYVNKFDDNIYEINFKRKGDDSRIFLNRFVIEEGLKKFDSTYKNNKPISELSVSKIYTRKDGLRAYSYIPLNKSAKYTKFRLYIEMGERGVLLFDFDEDIDPIMQEKVTKDMADAIEVVSPKK